MTLVEAKAFLRVDGDDEDALITSLVAGSEKYIVESTGKKFNDNDDLQKTALKIMVSHLYENRIPVVTGTIVSRIPFSFEMLLHLIALSSNYEKVDT